MLSVLVTAAATFFGSSLNYPTLQKQDFINASNIATEKIAYVIKAEINYLNSLEASISAIEALLQAQTTLKPAITDKVLSILKYTDKHDIAHNHILSIIDYSLPANTKRLWIFDLNTKQLLFHTYVSHGIKSGALVSNNFSNRYNSKCSSIGVYRTEKTYYGRDGLSLRLQGLEPGFNDNASNRSIVMHGSWYVNEPFIKKYGRSGRSWGCPAIPLNVAKPIINTIKDNSLFIVYYPDEKWLVKSRFLKENTKIPDIAQQTPIEENDQRDNVLLVHINKNYKSEENEAILVMQADQYANLFHTAPPLNRMLRRQIENTEYIALNDKEFYALTSNTNKETLNNLHFAIPIIKMVRGYFATEMKLINLGEIQEIQANANSFNVLLSDQSVINLRLTDRFIRWLGL